MIGLGTSGGLPFVATVVRLARSVGADTVGVVGAVTDPIASAAEIVLVAPAQTVGYLPSYTAAASLVHALTQVIALDRPNRGADLLMLHRALLDQYYAALRETIPQLRKALEVYSGLPRESVGPQD